MSILRRSLLKLFGVAPIAAVDPPTAQAGDLPEFDPFEAGFARVAISNEIAGLEGRRRDILRSIQRSDAGGDYCKALQELLARTDEKIEKKRKELAFIEADIENIRPKSRADDIGYQGLNVEHFMEAHADMLDARVGDSA